jgi:glycosyltransferase involved in cell wall biosynthesis
MSSQVSVVIATFNSAHFIRSTLQSVFAQTLAPREVIVVDDCSSDDTYSVVKSVAQDAPVPIRLVSLKKNSGGPSRPLNTGIQIARTEAIAILDHDDLMRPRRLEAQLRALSACPQCTVVIGRFAVMGQPEGDFSSMWPVTQFSDLSGVINEHQEYSIVESQDAFKPLFIRNYAGSASNLCFTKEWWLRLGKFDERNVSSSDLDFMLRAAATGPIAIVNETLFDYRIRGKSLLRTNVLKSALDGTMCRLRAASAKPEWAGDHLESLRYSALRLAADSLREGHWGALWDVIETLIEHKGIETIKRSLRKRTRRVSGRLIS